MATKVREAMMFKRIDHVEIVTDQPERTMQFYTEVLGFTVKSRDRIAAIAGAAGVEVSTHLYPEVAGHLMRVTETAHWLEWQDWANPILAEPFRLGNGHLLIPDRPGSGIEWGEDAIKRYRLGV